VGERGSKSVYKPYVPGVEQAARILLLLAKRSRLPMTLTEISKEIGVHKSRAYSILNTLQQFELVEKDSRAKTYTLGTGLIYLARRVLDGLDIREVATPFLEELVKETNSTVLLGLLSGEHLFVVAKYEGTQEIGVTVAVGHRFPLTFGAHGKVIAAFMSEEERQRLLSSRKLYFYGREEKFDPERLERELAECRRVGFAKDPGETNPGINAISAPIFGASGKIIGCLILVGTFDTALLDQYGAKVAAVARQLSRKLGAEVEEHIGEVN